MSAVKNTAEFRRVLNLPRRTEAEHAELAAEMTALLKRPGGTMALRPVQALALHDIASHGGGFLPIGVGEGKTLIFALAGFVLGAKKPMGLLPAGLIEKTERELRELAKHWLVPTNLRLFSYEMLGREQAAEELDQYEPDAFIGDEIHRLKNLSAACTRRVARRMAKHPKTPFVGMSGTVMRDSVHDFAHILFWCLKERAPLPMESHELDDWAGVLDEPKATRFGEEPERTEPGALLELCSAEELREQPYTAARLGFRRRLTETPGVVATAGDGENVGSSISLTGHVYKMSSATDEHFHRLRSAMQTPDGWELMSGVDVWRVSRELALGLHYVRVDRGRYRQWLADLPKSSGSTARNTTRNTTSGTGNVSLPSNARGERQTKSGTELIARGISRATKSSTAPKQGQEISLSTALQSLSGSCSGMNSEAAAQYVNEQLASSTSITAIGQDVLEGFFADPAIKHLGFSTTMSKHYRELFDIFLPTARPPREWLEPRKEWCSFVRAYLSRSRTLDSPEQVEQAVLAGKIDDQGLLDKWLAVEPTYQPETVPVWHDDSVLRVCAAWMKKPGIVWVDNTFFGAALSLLTGIPYYGAQGLDASGRYIEDSDSKTIIASIDANRDGKNLQHKWSRNLIVSPPEGWDVWQQCIARTHRPGQKADEVIVDVLFGCREHASAWRKAVAGTIAAKDTVGGTPKLMLADVSGIPSDDEFARFGGSRW